MGGGGGGYPRAPPPLNGTLNVSAEELFIFFVVAMASVLQGEPHPRSLHAWTNFSLSLLHNLH